MGARACAASREDANVPSILSAGRTRAEILLPVDTSFSSSWRAKSRQRKRKEDVSARVRRRPPAKVRSLCRGTDVVRGVGSSSHVDDGLEHDVRLPLPLDGGSGLDLIPVYVVVALAQAQECVRAAGGDGRRDALRSDATARRTNGRHGRLGEGAMSHLVAAGGQTRRHAESELRGEKRAERVRG